MDEPLTNNLMDIESACRLLVVSRRTFERAVSGLDISKVKLEGDKKLYYRFQDVQRVREHLDKRYKNIDRQPKPAAA